MIGTISTRRKHAVARRSAKTQRTGAALVEFVVCFPIFFIIAMATIDTCATMYLRQSVKLAAYECARLGITPGVTLEDLEDQCDVFLSGRHIENYTMTCSTTDLSTLNYQDHLTVSVSVPVSESAVGGGFFYQGETLSESVTIMAEY